MTVPYGNFKGDRWDLFQQNIRAFGGLHATRLASALLAATALSACATLAEG